MKHVLSSLLFILLCVVAVAQGTGAGCFKAYTVRQTEVSTFCIGQEITFQDCGNKVPDENEYYIFDYKAGSPIPTPASPVKKHTYTAPGKYRVLQIANYGGATLTDTVSRVYEVKAAVAPTFTYTICANQRITFTVTDNQYDTYFMGFGNGQQQQVMAGGTYDYTYNMAATYHIILTGTIRGAACPGQTIQPITILPTAPQPTIASLSILNQAVTGALEVKLAQLQPGYTYILESAPGAGQPYTSLDTITQVTQNKLTYKIKQANTSTKALYRVRLFDACGIAGQVSKSVGNVVLDGVSDGKALELYWGSLSNAAQYEVYRNGKLLKKIKGRTTFRDVNVLCGEAYTYVVKQLGTDGITSVSAAIQLTAVSDQIPAAPFLLATFDLDNHVQLTLQAPKKEQVVLADFERSINGAAAFNSLASSAQPAFTDASIDVSKPTCYRATYTNSCGNSSAYSNTTCPMLLQATRASDGAANLTWTAFKGFKDGVSQYVIEVLSTDKQLLATYTTNQTTYTDREPSAEPQQVYRIKAIATDKTTISYSNIITLQQPLQLLVPSAFTPNNDGLNDIFEAKGRSFKSFRMQIYNSLGNLVYASTDAAIGWDGTYKGKLVPAGVYTYTITVTGHDDLTTNRTGTVTLLR